jgi:predicted regulator of Ras-like GTPase activity (Roadblock/LC7/MglB family)
VSNIILLYESQKRIEDFLESFLIKTGAEQIYFAAKSGEVLVYSGSNHEKRLSSITALLASVFNVTEELARIVEENQFKQFFLRGKAWNLLYHNVSSESLLVVIFKEKTLLGSVRVLAESLVSKLKEEIKKKSLENDFSVESIDGKKLMEDLFRQ